MSKGPWKKKNRAPGATQSPAPDVPKETPKIEPKAEPSIFEFGSKGAPSEAPPPLPPMSGPTIAPNPIPVGGGAAGVGSSLQALRPGVSKTFCSVVNALPYWLEKIAPRYEFSIETMTADEGDLWAEFVLPVVDKWMPKFKDSPEYALVTITLVLIGGKIRVKKRIEAVPNVGSEINSAG